MSRQLTEIEENHKQEKQALLEVFSEESRLLSEKKSSLSREEESLLQALKKQEEQLLFEVQPVKNQIMDLQNRLEQERASRAKVLGAKEEVHKHLVSQKSAQEENFTQELSRFEIRTREEEQEAPRSDGHAVETWRAEKDPARADDLEPET